MYKFEKAEHEKWLKRIESVLDRTNISSIPQSILIQNENRHRLLFIVSSVAIEGNTFTIDEAEKLLNYDIVSSNRSYDEHQQVVNYYDAYNEMIELSARNAPLDIGLICRLHGLVSMGEVKSAGSLRKENVYISDSARVVHTPIGYEHVESMLNKAIDVYHQSTDDAFVRIARFHLEFEHINPFEDGNGRVGRLIMNYQLLQNGYFQINIPTNKRSLYMTAFNDYNRTSKIDKMLDIISCEQEKAMEHIQLLLDKYLGKKDMAITPDRVQPQDKDVNT